MATQRHAIRAALVTAFSTIAGLGSVNRYARAAEAVNDAPSLDVIVGAETPVHKPGMMVDHVLEVIVRIYGRHGDDDELDAIIEQVKAKVRADITLSGIVIDTIPGTLDTDEGWFGFAGLGSMADLRFVARWEDEET